MISPRILIIFILSCCLPLMTYAEQAELKRFVPGSYQQLLNNNINKPFILTIWSTTCDACLKKLPLLNTLRKSRPDINIIMLSTDDISVANQIQEILAKNELANLDNWVFDYENPQKLRYEIDPQWYGELPRTYFLNKNHKRKGISGTLSFEDHTTVVRKLAK